MIRSDQSLELFEEQLKTCTEVLECELGDRSVYICGAGRGIFHFNFKLDFILKQNNSTCKN